MNNPGSFKLAAQGDRAIVMTRVFNAPRRVVFDAFSKPELVRRWLLGPDGWSMPVCEIDFRVGGKFRHVWRHDSSGQQMGMGGEFLEILPPERIVATEKFDQAWYPGEAVGTIVLTEEGGKTVLHQTITYSSAEAREAVLKSPMESGVVAGYNRLDEVLACL